MTSRSFSLYNNLNKQGMFSDGSETPPDSTGAIGPNNYVEMDNSNIAVYDRTLHLVSSASLDAFTGSGLPFCDVQVQWDPAAQRFLFSFLMCDLNLTSSQQFWIGWSKTSDPSNLASGWCEFPVSTGSYLIDYDKLGHSSRYLVVAGNAYDVSISTTNPPFKGALISWYPMPANSDQSCTVPSVQTNSPGQKNGDGATPTFTPMPVNTTSYASDVWIISAYDPAGNVGPAAPKNKLSTWDIDVNGKLNQRSDITVSSYDTPTPAQQLGSTFTIDTLDARLMQAVGQPVTGIYTQHTVKDSAGRSQVDWYDLTQSGANLILAQQGVIDTASSWTFNAAISPRYDGGGAAIFYNVSSTTIDPVIKAQIRESTTASGTFLPGILTLATSPAAVKEDLSCNQPPGFGFPCRWGDYSGATPDPVNQSVVWGTNMYNTAATLSPAWSDENFAVVVPGVTQAPASSPTARPSVNPAPSATPGTR